MVLRFTFWLLACSCSLGSLPLNAAMPNPSSTTVASTTVAPTAVGDGTAAVGTTGEAGEQGRQQVGQGRRMPRGRENWNHNYMPLGWGDYQRPRNQNDHVSRALDMLELVNSLPESIEDIEGAMRTAENARRAALGEASAGIDVERNTKRAELLAKRIESYSNCIEMLEAAIAKQDPTGVAIARGLAGNEWKAIQDQSITSPWEGVRVGGALLISTKCGDSLGRRIAGTVDRVIGGTWDWGINGLINMWHALVGVVFPGAAKPFEFKTLGIWQDFIKIMFDNIDRFLKEGLKDSLRGKDSTLRKVDEPAVDDAQAMNVWRMLIEGYARQIDFFVSTIDQNLAAAQGAWVVEPNVVFFAQELRRRLLEFQAIITKPKSLKEFDALIDSNKSLITGYRSNIESLLQRLIASIDQPVSTTESLSSSGKPNRSSRGLSMDEDDNKLPGSFLGR